MPDSDTSLQLVLDVSVLGLRMAISGLVQDGGVAELMGSTRIPPDSSYSLDQLVENLQKNDKLKAAEAGQGLMRFLGTAAPPVRLTDLGFYYGIKPQTVQVQAAVEVSNLCSLRFLASKAGDGFVAGVDVRCDQSSKKDNALAGVFGEITFRSLGLFYASKPVRGISLPSPSADSFDLLMTPAATRDFAEGFSFNADISFGGIPLGYSPPPPSQPAPGTPAAPSPPQETIKPDGLTYWWEANKTIGPVVIRRVGFSYYEARPGRKKAEPTKYIGIKFDASLTLGPLAFSLEGAGIRYPFEELLSGGFSIEKFWNDLEFQFDGAGLSFSQGPLMISGGLIRVSEDPLQLNGTLLIRTAGFSIAALGSYADLGGEPSFFMFAVLLKELGGPPCFFVTGLAFGLGINRRLRLPDLNGVRTYPLVRAACEKDYLGAKLDLRAVSQKLDVFIQPSMGDYWIAAGVRFVSFGMIDSFVLLSVALGTRLEVGVLGLSLVRVPKELPGGATEQLPVIAYAELAIRIAFTPEAGILAAEAKLTENSYVLFKDCKLTGGFAFYAWFGDNPHRDDFVITLGGYHPRFQVPSHYPRPERLGLRCRLDEFGIDIQGGVYFALTPSAIMAGGALSMVYDRGWVKAWFIVQADFLIQWKPFHYDIEVGASIGLALLVDVGVISIWLRLELAAHVLLYGPPLGGWAEVTWWIVTVTIRFGEDPKPREIEWDNDEDPDRSFVKSFLGVKTGPDANANETLLQLDVHEGLLMQTQEYRVVRAHGLVLTTNSVIPASAVSVNGKPMLVGRPEIGVRPLKQKTLDSELKVTITPKSVSPDPTANTNHVSPTSSVITRSLPSALWGTNALDPRNPPEPDALVKDLPTGVRLKFDPPAPRHPLPVMDLKALAFENVPCTKCRWGTVPPTQTIAGLGNVTISSTIMDEKVSALRQQVLDELAKCDAPHGSGKAPRKVNLTYLGAKTPPGDDPHDTLVFHAPVIVSNVGQLPSSTGT